MSKPVVRVVLALLISFAIIGVIATSVQARLGNLLPSADLAAENQVVGRIGANERSSANLQLQYFDSGAYSGGGCDHSSSTDD